MRALRLIGELMSTRKIQWVLIGKLMVAATSIVGLVALAARELAPALPPVQLLLYCVAFLIGFLVLLAVVSIFSLQFSQLILRMGGTDAQWFWFSSEPKGLVALRKERAAQKEGE